MKMKAPPKRPPATLHTLMHKYANAAGIADRALYVPQEAHVMQKLDNLLRDGADPVARDAKGNTPLWHLATQSVGRAISMGRDGPGNVLEMLVHAGANPLLDAGVIPHYHPLLMLLCARLLSEQEAQGNRLRGHDDGSNLLHVLLKDVANGLGLATRLLSTPGPETGLPLIVHPDWINEKNDQGQTPLGTLFSPEQWPDRQLQDGRVDQYGNTIPFSDSSEQLWQLTCEMVERGADLFVVDHSGKRVLDCMADVFNRCPNKTGLFSSRVGALIEQGLLREATTEAGLVRVGPRL